MENIYSHLLNISNDNPDYYELLSVTDKNPRKHQIENAYKKKIQKLQQFSNNPKYKDIILYLKGKLRKARDVLTDKTLRTQYDLVLLEDKIKILQNEIQIFKIKGNLVKKEIRYIKLRGRQLNIPAKRMNKILGQAQRNTLYANYNNKGKYSNKNISLPVSIFSFLLAIGIFFGILIIFFYLHNRRLSHEITSLKDKIKTTHAKMDLKADIINSKKSEPFLPDKIKKKVVYVPHGYFYMGNDNGHKDEQPMRKIYLDSYYISRYEVTNKEYAEFINDLGYPVPYSSKLELQEFNWDPLSRTYPEGSGNKPVVLVSWKDASEYCKWLSNRFYCKVSLPTEAQWEKAARGMNKNIYPWGNSPPDENSYLANFSAGINGEKDGYRYLAPAKSFMKGKSPYGCFNMAGNVSEWCLDSHDTFAYEKIPQNNPFVDGDKTNWRWKVLRGGSWSDSELFIRTTYRFAGQINQIDIRWGFRYVINSK